MKKITVLATLVLVFLQIFSSTAVAADVDDSENRLFVMEGSEYIKRNPYDSNAKTSAPLLVFGKDKVVTKNEESANYYPLSINNTSDKNAYYYIAGSNNIELLMQVPQLIDYLKNDYVIEYDISYDSKSSGHVSLLINYNYSYYIDAYVSANGTGDILVCDGKIGEYKSIIADGSILDTTNPEGLLSAIYGDKNSDKTSFNVALRVSTGKGGMPEKMDIYVNGLKVASADAGKLKAVAQSYTPEYEIAEGKLFPQNAMGNIIALKCEGNSHAKLDNVRVYSTDKNAPQPLDSSVKIYAERYGNTSYTPVPPSDTDDSKQEDTSVNEDDSTSENDTEEETAGGKDDSKKFDTNVLIKLSVFFGVVDVVIIAGAVVLLKTRTKQK